MTQRSYSAYISPEKRGFLVSVFTFEIFQPDDTPSVSNVLKLAQEGAVWRHVEAMALHIQNRNGTFIRVKNSKDEIVVRAGVFTVLSSIEKCPAVDCPIKSERHRVLYGHRPASDLGFQIQCPLKTTDTGVFSKRYEAA
jgi:hypothetical protein